MSKFIYLLNEYNNILSTFSIKLNFSIFPNHFSLTRKTSE